jgi:hypothetical protein
VRYRNCIRHKNHLYFHSSVVASYCWLQFNEHEVITCIIIGHVHKLMTDFCFSQHARTRYVHQCHSKNTTTVLGNLVIAKRMGTYRLNFCIDMNQCQSYSIGISGVGMISDRHKVANAWPEGYNKGGESFIEI